MPVFGIVGSPILFMKQHEQRSNLYADALEDVRKAADNVIRELWFWRLYSTGMTIAFLVVLKLMHA